jgi:hypothetical protein
VPYYEVELDLLEFSPYRCLRPGEHVALHPEPNGDPPNGNQWLILDENSKYAYIVGFLEGMFQGHCFTTWSLPGGQENASAWANATKSYHDHWNRFVAMVTYQQFFDGLDNLYADYRNRKIEIQNGMWIVMNAISGCPEETMKSMIEASRQKVAGGI